MVMSVVPYCRWFTVIMIVIFHVLCFVPGPLSVSAVSTANGLLHTLKAAREARLKNQPINIINININNNDEHANENTNVEDNNQNAAIIFPAEVTEIWDFQTTPPPQQTIGQVTQLSSTVDPIDSSVNVDDESKNNTPFTDLVKQLAQG